MKELLEILEALKPGVDFKTEQHLIDDRILNSLEIMELVTEINDTFDISVPLNLVLPENFQSIDSIYAMIQRVLDEE